MPGRKPSGFTASASSSSEGSWMLLAVCLGRCTGLPKRKPFVLFFLGPFLLWLLFWSFLWSRGPVVPWSSGPLVLWSSGPVVSPSSQFWSCSGLISLRLKKTVCSHEDDGPGSRDPRNCRRFGLSLHSRPRLNSVHICAVTGMRALEFAK